MLQSDLNEERFWQLAAIYGRVAGVDATDQIVKRGLRLDDIIAQLSDYRIWEYRFGSNRSPHTKMLIFPRGTWDNGMIRITLDPNDDHGSKGYSTESQAMCDEFDRLVAEYLRTEAAAVELPDF